MLNFAGNIFIKGKLRPSNLDENVKLNFKSKCSNFYNIEFHTYNLNVSVKQEIFISISHCIKSIFVFVNWEARKKFFF